MMMEEAAESLYQKKHQGCCISVTKLCAYGCLSKKQFDKVSIWCERLVQQYPEELASYTCRLKLYFMSNDKEHFFTVMDQLKKSDIIIDNETLELIRVFS